MDGALTARARGLIRPGRRTVLGITGAPGAGKSTVAADLAERLETGGIRIARVPMDGFHLTQAELVERGLRDVMGRIDTFDADGYLTLLRRLRERPGEAITAPDFDRTREEPVPDSIVVGPDVQLVITEGNYLLDAAPPWPRIRATLDEVWFVAEHEPQRRQRLHARHVEFGKTETEARLWVERVDEPNARRVIARRGEADLVVDLS